MSFREAIAAAPDTLFEALHAQLNASSKGFDWPDAKGPMHKISEEIHELQRAIDTGDPQAIQEEIGDLLFSVINLCRFTNIAPADALHAATTRFEARVAAVENLLRERGRDINACSLDELDVAWQEIKHRARRVFNEGVDK